MTPWGFREVRLGSSCRLRPGMAWPGGKLPGTGRMPGQPGLRTEGRPSQGPVPTLVSSELRRCRLCTPLAGASQVQRQQEGSGHPESMLESPVAPADCPKPGSWKPTGEIWGNPVGSRDEDHKKSPPSPRISPLNLHQLKGNSRGLTRHFVT